MKKKKVLDVGCGAGREAEYLAKIFPNANIYAVDLNLALVGNGGKNDTVRPNSAHCVLSFQFTF